MRIISYWPPPSPRCEWKISYLFSWLFTHCVGWAGGCWPGRTAPPHSWPGPGASTGTRPTRGDSSPPHLHHLHLHLHLHHLHLHLHLQHLQHTVCGWQFDPHCGGSPSSLSRYWGYHYYLSLCSDCKSKLYLKSHPLTNFLFIAAR